MLLNKQFSQFKRNDGRTITPGNIWKSLIFFLTCFSVLANTLNAHTDKRNYASKDKKGGKSNKMLKHQLKTISIYHNCRKQKHEETWR